MPVPSAPRRAVLLPLALLAAVLAPGARAGAADEVGLEQIRALAGAARTIAFGSPAAVPLTIGGRQVVFTVSVSALGAITAVPQGAERAVKQISIAVTTAADGQPVPSSVTVITGDGEVRGFTVTVRDGMIADLVAGGPVTAPPRRSPLAELREDGDHPGPDGHHDRPDHAQDGQGPALDRDYFLGLGPGGSAPPAPGSPSLGGALLFAPGTSPQSQLVSPH